MKKLFYMLFSFFCTLMLHSLLFASTNGPHPRLYLNTSNHAKVLALANANDSKWTAMVAAANDSNAYFLPSERLITYAMIYRMKKAQGDTVGAESYALKARNYIFNGAGDNLSPIIITGNSTALTTNYVQDTTKSWAQTGYNVNNNLNVLHMYFINPNISQDKFWYSNRDYGSDGSLPAYNTNTFYVHPNPNLPLGSGHTGAQPRSTDMTTVASTGSTYVIVSAYDDSLKSTAHGMAVAYDWFQDSTTFSATDLACMRAYLRIAGSEASKMTVGMNMYAWTNYTTDGLRDIASIAYSLYGDDPYGATLLSTLHSKYTTEIQPSLNWIVDGGNWPEGEAYGSASVLGWLRFMWMVKDIEGIDYFAQSASQLKDRLDFQLLINYPTTLTGFDNNGSILIKPGMQFSDGARDQYLTYDNQRLSAFIIMNEFPTSREAQTAMTHYTTGGLTRVEARYMLCWEMLFYPTGQATQAITNVPTENASLNGGVVQMRSSWSDTTNATMALFKSGPHTHYHGHLDANSFQIYKYADLAPDTGSYSGSGGSPGTEYYLRTVAHNAMLFYDSAEVFDNIQNAPSINDGGQRGVETYTVGGSVLKQGSWQASGYNTGYSSYFGNEDVYQHGRITAYGAGTNYVYTAGDASSAYDGNTHKVTKAVRKFLYIRPDVFVVQDVYNLKNTSIEPNFLLHSVDGMTVTGTETVIQADGQYNYTGGNKITVTNGGGKLVMDTVYPSSVNVRKIGGTNRHNWVAGASREDGGGAYGKWRAEVRPATISTSGQMLNVLQTTSSSGTTLSTAGIEGIGGRGVLIGGNTVAMFSNAQSGTVSSMSYSATTTAASTHYIADLAPSTVYNVAINGGAATAYTATAAGVITFSDSTSGSRSYSVVQTGVTADTTAPVVTAFTVPTTATSLTVPVSTFTATDNTAVTGYCVTTTNSSSGCSWSGTAPASVTFGAAGSQTAYGWARDAAGNVSASVSDAVVITIPDTTAPTVAVSAPTSGNTVSGTNTITVSASDNVGVTLVEFYINGQFVFGDGSSPYQYTWDTTTVDNGSCTLSAKAYDAKSNVKTSSTVTVTVSNATTDTTSPTVSLTAPSASATITGAVTVSATASDNIGVSKVDFYYGATLIASDSTSPYSVSWTTTNVANATYSLTARAYDVAGNVTYSAARTVTVANSGSTVTVPSGDLNGDGSVGVADALVALQIAAGKTAPTSAMYARGDVAPFVSGAPAPNGKIDVGDAIVILAKTVGRLAW